MASLSRMDSVWGDKLSYAVDALLANAQPAHALAAWCAQVPALHALAQMCQSNSPNQRAVVEAGGMELVSQTPSCEHAAMGAHLPRAEMHAPWMGRVRRPFLLMLCTFCSCSAHFACVNACMWVWWANAPYVHMIGVCACQVLLGLINSSAYRA